MILFVEAVHGIAGWSLNVFLTPEGYPVTGFTYLPRDSFYQVLNERDKRLQQRQAEIVPIARDYFEQAEFEDDGKTVVRFTLNARGEVANISYLESRFTNYGLEVLE